MSCPGQVAGGGRKGEGIKHRALSHPAHGWKILGTVRPAMRSSLSICITFSMVKKKKALVLSYEDVSANF